MTENTNNTTSNAQRFTKGQNVWQIGMWWVDNTTTINYVIQELTIQSWGKQQGTATRMVNGKFTKHRFYTDRVNTLFATREEAERYIRDNATTLMRTRASGALRCEHSAFPYLLPDHREAGKVRIALLETIVTAEAVLSDVTAKCWGV